MFQEKIKAENECSLEWVTGNDQNGQPIFAYVLVPAVNVDKFRKALATREVTMSEFGLVLASGKGHTPFSEEQEKQLLHKFEATDSNSFSEASFL